MEVAVNRHPSQLKFGATVKTLHAIKFLVLGPVILATLVIINLATSPGQWWVQWAALGIGIAWVINLFRVLKALALIGGLTALAVYLTKRWQTSGKPWI